MGQNCKNDIVRKDINEKKRWKLTDWKLSMKEIGVCHGLRCKWLASMRICLDNNRMMLIVISLKAGGCAYVNG